MSSIHAISGCPHLYDVTLMCATAPADDELARMANPLCLLPGYVASILSACPALQFLDGVPIAARKSMLMQSAAPKGASPEVLRSAARASAAALPASEEVQRRDPEMSVLRHEVAYMQEESKRIAFASKLADETQRVQLEERAAEIALLKRELR